MERFNLIAWLQTIFFTDFISRLLPVIWTAIPKDIWWGGGGRGRGKMQNACTLGIALSDGFLNFEFRICRSKCRLVTVFWNLGYKCYLHCCCICVVWYSYHGSTSYSNNNKSVKFLSQHFFFIKTWKINKCCK